MDKTYQPQKSESKIYKAWESGNCFIPKINQKKKPFSILLPLPNANDPMHMGHALFAVQDILTRYHRMLGDPTLWLPGGDHAGIETQYVFEKKLAKEGKSRFDFDRETLYQKITDFVEENKDINKDQMKKLGFSLDWSRYHYSLEPEILKTVFETFEKLHQDNLVYRAEKLVNFCPHCGTAFSELEVNYQEEKGKLYYLNYGSIQIATTRPETIFADVAVAVSPKSKKYKPLIGKEAIIPLIDKSIPIIKDKRIDPQFGTGALKVTPAHDQTDFEIGQDHQLPVIKIIDRFGKMINVPQEYQGLKVIPAREKIVKDLKEKDFLVKEKGLTHNVAHCYRCNRTIEPTLMPQWFVKTKSLAQKAIEAVKQKETKIVPKKRFEKMYFDWMENILDWNISRQIAWGPRIPAWYCLDCHSDISLTFINKKKSRVTDTWKNLKDNYSLKEINQGLQSLTAPVASSYQFKPGKCQKCKNSNLIQETDTFDTWFLSGQWPLTTLGFPDSKDFQYFYPTTVLDTMWDILFFWVARMMMLGIYRTGKAPFKVIHLHCRVVDKHGQKMSKSKNNVINPLEMTEKYGTDALRMALIFGASPGSDIALSEDKVRAMRNFANKIWNIGRFLNLNLPHKNFDSQSSLKKNRLDTLDKELIQETEKTITQTTQLLEKYRFDLALEGIYHFAWHRLADHYLEKSKQKLKEKNQTTLASLFYSYTTVLKLLHPFAPFVTEEIWDKIPHQEKDLLIVSPWPKNKEKTRPAKREGKKN